MELNNLSTLDDAQSRSISPENFSGEKGKGGMATKGTGETAARELGQGWKVSPSVRIKAGCTFELADITGPGMVEQIWMTPTGNWRFSILRIYWDDQEFPTICGTGTEDYFCGSHNFENQETGQYQAFTTPYAGMPHVLRPDGVYQSQMRFGLYRWHITDPVRFLEDIRVTIQALGWRSDRRYLPLQDDISSVAFWYQTLPTQPFPQLPDKDALEII